MTENDHDFFTAAYSILQYPSPFPNSFPMQCAAQLQTQLGQAPAGSDALDARQARGRE
jgi:hypothetical protein